jgi:hypothetical protein
MAGNRDAALDAYRRILPIGECLMIANPDPQWGRGLANVRRARYENASRFVAGILLHLLTTAVGTTRT